jgi:hypothetical protein
MSLSACSMVAMSMMAVAPRNSRPTAVSRPALLANWVRYFCTVSPAAGTKLL